MSGRLPAGGGVVRRLEHERRPDHLGVAYDGTAVFRAEASGPDGQDRRVVLDDGMLE